MKSSSTKNIAPTQEAELPPDTELMKSFFEIALPQNFSITYKIPWALENIASNVSNGEFFSVTDNHHIVLMKKDNDGKGYTMFNSLPTYNFMTDKGSLLPANTTVKSPILQPSGPRESADESLNNACSVCTYFLEAVLKKNPHINLTENHKLDENLIKATKRLYFKVLKDGEMENILSLGKNIIEEQNEGVEEMSEKYKAQKEKLQKLDEYKRFSEMLNNELSLYSLQAEFSELLSIAELLEREGGLYRETIEALEKKLKEIEKLKHVKQSLIADIENHEHTFNLLIKTLTQEIKSIQQSQAEGKIFFLPVGKKESLEEQIKKINEMGGETTKFKKEVAKILKNDEGFRAINREYSKALEDLEQSPITPAAKQLEEKRLSDFFKEKIKNMLKPETGIPSLNLNNMVNNVPTPNIHNPAGPPKAGQTKTKPPSGTQPKPDSVNKR